MTPGRARLRGVLVVAATTLGVVLAVAGLALVTTVVGVRVAVVPTFLAAALLGVLASPPVRGPLERRRAEGRGTILLAVGAVLAATVLSGLGLNLLTPVAAAGNAVHAAQLRSDRRALGGHCASVVGVSAGAWAAQALGLVDGLVDVREAGVLVLGLLATTLPLVVTSAGLARALGAERRARIDALEHAARHDSLTGLLSRDGMHEALSRSVSAVRPGMPTGLVYVDLDGFKAVNDGHGHAAGDALLREVAERIRAAIGPRGQVARVGGDEFVVVLPGLTHPGQCDELARSVRTAVEAPVVLPGGTRVQVGASTGTAVADTPAPAEALLARADAQMYARKRHRRSSGRHRDVTAEA